MARRGKDPLVRALQLKLAAAKAANGLTWQHISLAMAQCGIRLSPTNLMSKQSRGSFKANELIVLLRLLEVNTLDLSDIDIDGLAQAKAALQALKNS